MYLWYIAVGWGAGKEMKMKVVKADGRAFNVEFLAEKVMDGGSLPEGLPQRVVNAVAKMVRIERAEAKS
jgi:hypothetical protein